LKISRRGYTSRRHLLQKSLKQRNRVVWYGSPRGFFGQSDPG